MITIAKNNIDIIERKLQIEEEIEVLLKQVRKLRIEHENILQILTNKISPDGEYEEADQE